MATNQTKKKLTKDEREIREAQLADVMFYALSTPTEEHARAWATRAKALMEGLSKTSIKRAKDRAHKMADDLPPGHVKAMEAMEIYEDICRKHKVPRADKDTLWGAIAQFCMFQLSSRQGPFYEAARSFNLAPPDQRSMKVEIVRLRPNGETCGNPKCPNCRPRAAEELN